MTRTKLLVDRGAFAVCSGQTQLGWVLEISGGQWRAFGLDEKLIAGTFDSMKQAARALGEPAESSRG